GERIAKVEKHGVSVGFPGGTRPFSSYLVAWGQPCDGGPVEGQRRDGKLPLNCRGWLGMRGGNVDKGPAGGDSCGEASPRAAGPRAARGPPLLEGDYTQVRRERQGQLADRQAGGRTTGFEWKSEEVVDCGGKAVRRFDGRSSRSQGWPPLQKRPGK